MKNVDYDSIRFSLLKQRILQIKQKIRVRERNSKKELEKKAIESIMTLSSLKIIPKNEITYNSMFARNPFDKKNYTTFNFEKHKLSMEMNTRNMQKNRIEHVVRQIGMKHIKAKSRLHLNDRDMVKEIQRKIERNAKRNNSIRGRNITKQSSSIRNDISETYKENEGNRNENEYQDCTNCAGKNNQHIKLHAKISQIQNVETETKTNQRSQSSFHYRNQTVSNESVTSTQLKIDPKNRRNSVFFLKERKSVVVNKPIYTKNINEFIQEYQRLKVQLNKEQKQLLSYGIMGRHEIESIMKARTDMKMLNLRHKFVTTIFKPSTGQLSVKQQKERFLFNFNKEVENSDPNYLTDNN